MAPPADRLGEIALATLNAVRVGFIGAGVELPTRQLVAPGTSGLLAFDCELVAVNLERTFTHDGNVASEVLQPIKGHPGLALRGAGLAVTIVRKVPSLRMTAGGKTAVIPDAADEETAALRLLVDAQVLTNVLVAAVQTGDLANYCNSAALEGWRAIGPGGMFAGGILTLRIGLA